MLLRFNLFLIAFLVIGIFTMSFFVNPAPTPVVASCRNDDGTLKAVCRIKVTPTPTLTPTATENVPVKNTPTPTVVIQIPTPTPKHISAASAPAPVVISGRQSCFDHPDRYNWQKYARLVGFPQWVMDELSYVIQKESSGDLCARNVSSGASCWVQLHPGRPEYFDPLTCMRGGFKKWMDGGQSFQKHWFNHW